MPYPRLPLDAVLIIARHMRHASGELRYREFNALLMVNSELYACLNSQLWQSAAEDGVTTGRVIMHLITTDNLAALKAFLERGADVNACLPPFDEFDPWNPHDPRNPLGCPTPLLVAASRDNVPLAHLLLKHGADLVVQHLSKGYNAIHAARSAEMVELLLDHGADLNQTDNELSFSFRPLHYYAMRGNVEAIRVALQNGAELHLSGVDSTPLHEAAAYSHDGVQVLLEHGADPQARTDFLWSRPLHVAAKAGQIEVVKLLLSHWPEGLWQKDKAGATPLHWAAAQCKLDVVRHFVKLWPTGTISLTKGGRTPLMLFECGKDQVDAATREEIRALLQ
jgi:ankyrin repeat protein